MFEFVLAFFLLVLPEPSCTNSDNIALLTGTLETIQRAACGEEMIALSCPQGTFISIQVAVYGKAAADSHGCTPQPTVKDPEAEDNCLLPNTMQYSLLQTVVEACQKKPKCKFSTKTKPGLVDPCPHVRKFVEVAYKCRPFEFRSRTACEDDVIKLSCNPRSRIAIFDAQYGRAEYESIACPQAPSTKNETCLAPYAMETVMQICLGKRRCQIGANSKTFGSPCKPDSKAYLKVIYACVPLGILMDRYEKPLERDEIIGGSEVGGDEGMFDESDGAGEKWGEPNAVSPIANPEPFPQFKDLYPNESKREEKDITVHKPKNTKEVHEDVPQNNSNVITYILGTSIIVIAIIAIIGISGAVRCYLITQRTRNSQNGNMFTTEAPNVFNDAVSDIDTDVDVSHISGTFYNTEHPDMILYRDVPGKGTLRAMRPLSTIYPCAGVSMYGNVDYIPPESRDTAPRFTRSKDDPEVTMNPKSLSSYSNSQFYYG